MPSEAFQDRRATRNRIAAFVVTAIVACVLAIVARPREGTQRSLESGRPDQSVAAMVAAEKEGNVSAYLDCFTGPLAEQLRRRMSDRSDERLSTELREGAAGLSGYVTTELETETPDSAAVMLERVYRDYNERHRVQLRHVAGAWKISEISVIERFAPEIAYGTPVYQAPGETADMDDAISEAPM